MLFPALAVLPMLGAADPWHLPGWQARAVVEIPQPLTGADVDTAAVRILCQGRGKPDGSDYRVLDADGRPVPFQLMFHDGDRYSLVAFRASDPRRRSFVYFGNPQADRAAEQVVADPAPGSGPPKGEWVPRSGLVYSTLRRPEGENPKTVAEMAKLIAASPSAFGARYQRRVADGYNPFGPSDFYISIYRGWIEIPRAGSYQFCTVSNEASFSFLDGKELVHWPGRHTVERGERGEVHATVELAAGRHYLEYDHEEVTLQQMAYLGWRPSADAGPFAPIPESIYTAPHEAVVTRYERPDGPLVVFEPTILDSIWPVERHEGQYTRIRFQAVSPSGPSGPTDRWDFGDGQTATGPVVEHVYLAPGRYPVTRTAEGPGGTSTARWPLEVFEIEHVTDQFPEGNLAEYARLAQSYDRNRLDAASLKELAHLLAESDDPAGAVEAGQAFVSRFGEVQPEATSRVRRLMAACVLRLGRGKLDEAITQYQESITAQTPAAEALDVLARLIDLLGIEADRPEQAAAVLVQVEQRARGAKLDDETLAAYRRAVIAAGDVQLWHGQAAGARDLYQKAERLGGQFIPSQVRAARIGAYPNALREFLEAGDTGAALALVARWDESFPTDKPNGQTFYWRGKILALRGQHRDAARHLARAVGLAVGAAFESEARWLLAQSLEQLGRPEDARRELAKLVASGSTDPFAQMARAKLKAK